MKSKWNDVNKKMPEVDKFGDSEYLLCLEEDCADPVVAFYNKKENVWKVGHWTSKNAIIEVASWKKIV